MFAYQITDELDGKIFGRVLGNNVYFQIKWKHGDLTCKADGKIFDGKPSYHTTYAQCPRWPKNNVDVNITIELNGEIFDTTPEEAIAKGKIQLIIKNTGMSQYKTIRKKTRNRYR